MEFRYIWTVIVSMVMLFPFDTCGQTLRKISLSYETGDFRFRDVDSICYIQCLNNTAVSCHNEVTIFDSFEVKPGASFEININPTYNYE